jgi:hypothetical protein
LNAAQHAVEQTADPQTESARRIVAWLTVGTVKPTGDDFVMLRLTDAYRRLEPRDGQN